jgi:parvulin-like peptidyl-prolyl isomerase
MKKINIAVIFLLALISCQNKSVNDKVIAKVGSQTITESYLNGKMQELGPEAANYLTSKAGKKQFLDMIVNEKIISMAAQNSAVKNSKEYNQKVDEMKKQLDTRLKDFKDYLLTRMFIEDLKKKELEVSNEEAKSYIEKYPKLISIEHIVTDDYAKAQEMLEKIKSGKSITGIMQDKNYKDIAMGGKLPPVMAGEFLPELEDMIYKMKVGEVQGVVKSRIGYHVIKKISEEKINPDKPEFIERAKRVLEKKKFDEYMNNMQKKYKVEVLDESYK